MPGLCADVVSCASANPVSGASLRSVHTHICVYTHTSRQIYIAIAVIILQVDTSNPCAIKSLLCVFLCLQPVFAHTNLYVYRCVHLYAYKYTNDISTLDTLHAATWLFTCHSYIIDLLTLRASLSMHGLAVTNACLPIDVIGPLTTMARPAPPATPVFMV